MKIIRKGTTFGLIFWKKNACMFFNPHSRILGGFRNAIETMGKEKILFFTDGCFSILAIWTFENQMQ